MAHSCALRVAFAFGEQPRGRRGVRALAEVQPARQAERTRLSITGTTVRQGALLVAFHEGLQPLDRALPLWGSLHSCNALAIDGGSGRIVLAGGWTSSP